ncbi:MAG: hypothetical protein ACRYFU_03170 [Janthinobacterium lividum]
MDLTSYRELLRRFHGLVLASGEQTAKIPGKWLADFDQNFTYTADSQALMRHLDQVRRSAGAFAILADGLIEKQSLPVLEGLLDSTASELLVEVNRVRERLLSAKRVLEDRGVQGIVGEDLSSVVFVMDYVQFDFNGARLTTFAWPEWGRGGERLRANEMGYRDALCKLIGARVSGVTQTIESLSIDFTNGEMLVTSLRAEDASGPESASFLSETGLLWIW